MSVYIWIAILGAIGLLSMIFFFFFFLKDIKFKKKLKRSFWVLLPNWLLAFISILSFSAMIFLFIYVKDQLVQLQ